MLELSNDLFQL